MFFYPFDWTFLLLLPALFLGMYAQQKVRSAYARYSRVPASSRYSGAEVAKLLISRNLGGSVDVRPVAGTLTDHYDPRARVVKLSEGIFDGRSIAAIGVAAHEVGHAVQHGTGYKALAWRNSLVPAANLGSSLLFPLFIGGVLFGARPLLDLGIILFSFAVLFQLITLPVELDASRRALAMLRNSGVLAETEIEPAKKVLNAAALTYVAAAAMAVLTLVRLLLLRERD